MQQIEAKKVFGGSLTRWKHNSELLHCEMVFSVFVPPNANKVPVLWYLSGLTCNDQNFVTKATVAFKTASAKGIAIVAPDTSPRGLGIEGEDADWDFGTGAGMYVDATQEPWTKGYFMYSYITKELPSVLAEGLPVLDFSRQSITGHSMGGHGALTIALKNPDLFKSVSAFAPICNASAVPWGIKAFTGYLGSDKETWKQYDALELAKAYQGKDLHVLVHQGGDDNFLKVQLSTSDFQEVLRANPALSEGARVHVVDGYDHSYYFISTFVEEHVEHHAKYLFA